MNQQPTSIRARLLARLGVDINGDEGLATTETVILTAFLVAIAAIGAAFIVDAVNDYGGQIDDVSTTPN